MLLLFSTLQHASAEIRGNLASANSIFRIFSDGKRDYVYIETTRTRLIGFYNESFEKAPDPIIVPVGTSQLQYGKIDPVMKIFFDLKAVEREPN